MGVRWEAGSCLVERVEMSSEISSVGSVNLARDEA